MLEEEREILAKAAAFRARETGRTSLTRYRFVEREKARLHLAALCRVLGVSPSGFRAWARRPARPGRPPTPRCWPRILPSMPRRAAPTARRGSTRRCAPGPPGGPQAGRAADAPALPRGRPPAPRPAPVRTAPGPGGDDRPDLVRRDFSAASPDRLWVADITDLPTGQGPLHLAAILDAFSRRVVGWSMADHLRTELVLDALEAAIAARRPAPGLVHHSDRGTQYTSLALGARLAEAGIAASMGAPGTAYDNAMAESFFASLETELIDRSGWPSHAAARLAVFDWIERFYNRQRIHSAIGYLSRRVREEVPFDIAA